MLCSSSDHPLTQFLLQYQYYVYRKLAPLVKDVGFPDVRSGRKATSPRADVVIDESHSDEEAVKTKSKYDGVDEEKQVHDPNLKRLPSDSDSEESGNKADEVQEVNTEEMGHDVELHEVVPGDTSDVETGSTADTECVSSVTDLEKLKNLLQEEAQPETSKADITQVDDSSSGQESSAAAVANESENLESYFQELEDDMFGWESDEAEKNASDNETGDTEDCREISNEKSFSENIEEGDRRVEENRTEVIEESTDANDVAMSSQEDSPQGEDSHSSSDTHEPSETDQEEAINPRDDGNTLTTNESDSSPEEQCTDEKRTDSPQGEDSHSSSDTNEPSETDQEEAINPRDDGNTLTTNESDSSPEEQCTDEKRTSGNTNDDEEEVQDTKDLETRETPEERTFDQTNCGDQENAQIPKLPSFAGEDDSNKKQQDSDVPLPPTDEVRKQLKDVLVDVRFILGRYI